MSTVRVCVLRAALRLQGCRSLKEKRRRLGGLRDKFGRHSGLAVCESGCNDELARGEWQFVAAATSVPVVQKMLAEVERHLRGAVDAELLMLEREWLV